MAVLANLEKKHRQAKALLEKAQLLGGNEQFWYNSTVSLIEAILEEEGEEKQRSVWKYYLLFCSCTSLSMKRNFMALAFQYKIRC